MTTDDKLLERARRYARRRCNWYKRNTDRGCHWGFAVQHALEDTEKRFPELKTFGVEGDTAQNGEGHITISYLNTGESYKTTIVHFRGKFRVASWGDCVEAWERRHGRSD